ncbi:MAG: DUF4340 domain-containing protein, partial [Candidatus Hydrogenedentes bacterium]|nr:DUF4340 domain-containing protein [Candidatus Hydrogenedentota bacterium]
KSRYVTQDTGDVITLANEQVKKLEITTTDLAAKGLLAAKQDEVREVALQFEGVSYRFTKGEQAWKIDEPAGKVWESQSDMKALLAELSSVRATAIEQSPAPADLKPFGLDTPTLSVRLSAAPSAPDGQTRVLGPLMIGALCTDSPHERYAMVAGRADLFRVKQTLVDTLRDALRGVVDAAQP